MNKNILLILFAGLLLVMVLKDCSGCTEPTEVPPSTLDSLTAAYEEKLFQKDVIQTSLQWEIRDLNMARRWDSVAIGKALQTIKPLNSKVAALIDANKDLKAANDTLSRLNNCDTLAEYAGYLIVQVDSLHSIIPQYQNTINELVMVYDAALNAANDKALTTNLFASQMRQAAKDCEADRERIINNKQRESRLSLGLHGGYGLTAIGPSPVISFGINYELIGFKKSRKNLRTSKLK